MTPLAIEIALHYHTCGTDFLPGSVDTWPGAQQDVIKLFLENDLLMVTTVLCSKKPLYKPTNKLHAYCDHLCNLPLPILKNEWIFENTLKGHTLKGHSEFVTDKE